jgi:hypothetical protein
MHGTATTNVDCLRAAHNALSLSLAIPLDGLDLPKTAKDAYHFIVYFSHTWLRMRTRWALVSESQITRGPYEEHI